MFRKKFFSQITKELLPAEFRIIRDFEGNEYVVFRDNPLNNVLDFRINDKTLFEAMENHIHLFKKIKKREIPYLIKIGECVCSLALGKLEKEFPNKKFIVYFAIQTNESVIFRFHQIWAGEQLYYGDNKWTSKNNDLIIVSTKTVDG